MKNNVVYVISYTEDTDSCEWYAGVSYVFNKYEDACEMLEKIKNDELKTLENDFEEIEATIENDKLTINCDDYYKYIEYVIAKMEVK